MNIQEKIEKKKRKLQRIKDAITEGIIYSQIKYLEYSEKEKQLENDIKQLENLEKLDNKNEKIWIDMGNGWKKRINKND